MKIMETKQRMKVPIAFEDYKICPHCGSHTVKAIDKYNREMDILIYPISKFHCNSCNSDFFPNWIQDGDKMIPVAGDEELKREFECKVNEFGVSNRRKLI